jgi:hypothetical protein
VAREHKTVSQIRHVYGRLAFVAIFAKHGRGNLTAEIENVLHESAGRRKGTSRSGLILRPIGSFGLADKISDECYRKN